MLRLNNCYGHRMGKRAGAAKIKALGTLKIFGFYYKWKKVAL